jgi:hypothetical protein
VVKVPVVNVDPISEQVQLRLVSVKFLVIIRDFCLFILVVFQVTITEWLCCHVEKTLEPGFNYDIFVEVL